MFDNHFTKHYKSIPIARFAYSHQGNTRAFFLTPPELHKEFEIILITNGSATVTINNIPYNGQSGDMFFISPYTIHSVKINEYQKFSHICHCFNLTLLHNDELKDNLLSQNLLIRPYIPASTSINEPLKNLFLNIENALVEGCKYWEIAAQANLMLLFSEIVKNDLCTTLFPSTYNKDFCVNVIDFLETHYREKITSKSVAEYLYFTQAYFCRVFKKNFGMNFANFLNLYRIEKSKSFLSDTSLSITDVAYKCGFSDTSYFVKVFRQQNNIPPQKFREIFF